MLASEAIQVDVGMRSVRSSFVSADMQDLAQHLSPTSVAPNKDQDEREESEEAQDAKVLHPRTTPPRFFDRADREPDMDETRIQDWLQWRNDSGNAFERYTFTTVWAVVEDARLELWRPYQTQRFLYFDFFLQL